MDTSVSGPLSEAALNPSCGFRISIYEVTRRLQRGMLALQEAVDTAALTTSTVEVQSNHAQCEALAEEFRVGVTEIDGLVRVILQLLTEVDSDQLCGKAVVMSVKLLFASLEEIWRCIIMATDFKAKCFRFEVPCPGFDPNLSTSGAVTLFQRFLYCRTLLQVGFYRFLIELRMLGVLKSPVGWNLSKDVADEFCNCAPLDLFEWCVRSCRPVLKQLHLELGEQVMQHPHPGMDHLWLQLREAIAERARCSLWTQVLDEPSAQSSDSLPLRVNSEDFQTGRHLGQGSFGSVFQCKWHDEDIAVKIIPLDVAAPGHQEKFQREVEILWSLRHPNIVQTFGYGLDTQGSGSGFIMMERMETALDKLIRDLRRDGGSHVFPLDVSMDLMSQIVEGMCALRDRRVMHRDLKPGNILVNRVDNGVGLSERIYQVKLADFGTSKQHDVHTSIFTTMKVGTPSYMAPEICAAGTRNQGYSWEADVYSFGMVCSEILTGERPFQHLSILSCQNVLAAVRGGERPKLLLSREDPLRTLIEDCWKLQPHERPNVCELRTRLSQCRLRLFFITQIPQMSNLFALHQLQIISDQLQQISNLQEQHSDLQNKMSKLQRQISDPRQKSAVRAGVTLSTTFVNKTTLTFKLKESDDGVYREICTLRGLPDENAQPSDENKITLEFDARSTYKEYRLSSSRTASEGRLLPPVKFLVSSDFIMDNSTIYIVPNPTPNEDNSDNYVIQGEVRSVSNFWPVSKLLRLFKRN